ncbi:hypothetical protein MUP65_01130 [Patescibacteria group bacterium]|nr:hypothetical protein [Patescibacteria group bacterium]
MNTKKRSLSLLIGSLVIIVLAGITSLILSRKESISPADSPYVQLEEPADSQLPINKVQFLISSIETPKKLPIYTITELSPETDHLCQLFINLYKLTRVDTTDFDPNLKLWVSYPYDLNCTAQDRLLFSIITDKIGNITLDQANQTASQFFSQIGLELSPEITANPIITYYEVAGGDIIYPTVDPNRANHISLDYYPKIESYPLYTASYPSASISLLVSPENQISKFSYSPVFAKIEKGKNQTIVNFANIQKLIKTNPERLTILDYAEVDPNNTGYDYKPPNLEEITTLYISQAKLIYYPTEDKTLLTPAYLLEGSATTKTGYQLKISLVYPAIGK